jgi:peptidylprolyl isomerase
MNGLRHSFVSAVILTGTLLTMAAEPSPGDPVAVPIHSGNHSDFGRVVFDVPPQVSYRVIRDGDRVTVRFADGVALGASPAPPRNVLSIHANSAQAELIVAAGASLHDMRIGSRIVLDVFDPVANGATPSPAPASRSAASVPAPHEVQTSSFPPKPSKAENAAAPLTPAKTPAGEPRAEPPATAPVSAAADQPAPTSQANPEPPAGDGRAAVVTQRVGNPSDTKGAVSDPRSLKVSDFDTSADIVAERGDVKLTAADIRAMLDRLDPAQRSQAQATPAALAKFVRDRLLRQTLLADAHAANWDQNADVIARANDARDAVIVQMYRAARAPPDANYPSQADIAATYEANRERFTVPKQYHAAQIAILVPAGAGKDVDDAAHLRVQELRQQALDPNADFADLANRNSQDRPTVGRGGDLDWVREDQLVPALRDVVTTLSENAISEPVRSPEAWHIVKLLGTKPPSVLPLDQVRDSLVQALRQTMAQQLARAYVDDLLRKEPIKLNEIDLAHRISAAP